MNTLEAIPSGPVEKKTGAKSLEHAQAQVEVFADRGVKEFSDDQKLLLQYSAELAKIKNINDLPSGLPLELVESIGRNKQTYLTFLRKENIHQTAFIERNIQLYREKFQTVIRELKARMAASNPRDLPEYLGSGSNGSAFRIEVDGHAFAAKFSSSVVMTNLEIKPLLRAQGVPNTAQLACYSFADGVVIMELLPGRPVDSVTPEETPEYTDEEIAQLIETVKQLDARGLMIDPKASNFLYSKERGFSILDFHFKLSDGSYELPEQVADLRFPLLARKFPKISRSDPDYQLKIARDPIDRQKIYLPTKIKFLRLLTERYPQILEEWKRRRNEKIERGEQPASIASREGIPDHPDLQPYLEQLKALGF